MDGWTDGRMGRRMDRWIKGWTDGRMDGRLARWMDENLIHRWIDEEMVLCIQFAANPTPTRSLNLCQKCLKGSREQADKGMAGRSQASPLADAVRAAEAVTSAAMKEWNTTGIGEVTRATASTRIQHPVSDTRCHGNARGLLLTGTHGGRGGGSRT